MAGVQNFKRVLIQQVQQRIAMLVVVLQDRSLEKIVIMFQFNNSMNLLTKTYKENSILKYYCNTCIMSGIGLEN
jgi:hypothetical protein